MKRNFEDYKILVRHNENEDFKEIDYIDHSIESFTSFSETDYTHTILYVDENGELKREKFDNEAVKFELKTSTDGFKFAIDGTKACEEIKKLISEEVGKLKRLGAVQ